MKLHPYLYLLPLAAWLVAGCTESASPVRSAAPPRPAAPAGAQTPVTAGARPAAKPAGAKPPVTTASTGGHELLYGPSRLGEFNASPFGPEFWKSLHIQGVIVLATGQPEDLKAAKQKIGDLELLLELGTAGQPRFVPETAAQFQAQLEGWRPWLAAFKETGGRRVLFNMEDESHTTAKGWQDPKVVWAGKPAVAKARAQATVAFVRSIIPGARLSTEAIEPLMEGSKLDCYIPWSQAFYAAQGGGGVGYYCQYKYRNGAAAWAKENRTGLAKMGPKVLGIPGINLNTGDDVTYDVERMEQILAPGGGYLIPQDCGEVFSQYPKNAAAIRKALDAIADYLGSH